MGRVLLLLLVVVAIVLLWMAFKPSTWKRRPRGVNNAPAPREVKGPDDDEEFLWNIEKNRFKERRAQEAAQLEEEERMNRARKRYAEPEQPDDSTGDATDTGESGETPTDDGDNTPTT